MLRLKVYFGAEVQRNRNLRILENLVKMEWNVSGDDEFPNLDDCNAFIWRVLKYMLFTTKLNFQLICWFSKAIIE